MSDKKLTAKGITSAEGKKAPRTRSAKPDPVAAEREQWATLRPSMKVEQATAYDMNGTYKAKSLVRHALFGMGVVTSVAGSRKMEVLFEEGKKLLRCQ